MIDNVTGTNKYLGNDPGQMAITDALVSFVAVALLSRSVVDSKYSRNLVE